MPLTESDLWVSHTRFFSLINNTFATCKSCVQFSVLVRGNTLFDAFKTARTELLSLFGVKLQLETIKLSLQCLVYSSFIILILNNTNKIIDITD